MRKPSIHGLATSAILALSAVSALAADPQPAEDQSRIQTQAQARDQDRIYGSQLMTREERLEYQNRMRELKTQQEREQFRQEHHAKMQERAKERGLKLPDEPPVRGKGTGPRYDERPGMGQGTGPRGGAGSGRN